MNRYETIKQMSVNEIALFIQDIAKQTVSEIEEKTKLNIKAKPTYLYELKQWLLEDVNE